MGRQSYHGKFADGNGKVVASGTVSVYLSGSTTAASVYTASSGGTAVNSVTSDSTDGTFAFYVDTDDYPIEQKFKITLTKTGYTTKSYDNLTIFSLLGTAETGFYSGARYYPNPSETDQGAASGNVQTVKDIVDTVGTSKSATIVLRHLGDSNTTSYTFDTSESIPSNIRVEFEEGAILARTTGDETLTFDNSGQIVAGNRQKLTAANMLVFTNGGSGYAEWWGAVGDGDGAGTGTDDYAEIQYAVTRLTEVILHPVSYNISDEITVSAKTKITSYGLAELYQTTVNKDGIIFEDTADDSELSRVKISNITQDDASEYTAVRIKGADRVLVEKCYINGADDSGISVRYDSTDLAADCIIRGNYITGITNGSAIELINCTNPVVENNYCGTATQHGIRSAGVTGGRIANNFIENFGSRGLYIRGGGNGSDIDWPLDNCTYTGNVILIPESCVGVDLSSEAEGVSITGNLIRATSSTGVEGIHIETQEAFEDYACRSVSITGNTVKTSLDAGNYALYVTEAGIKETIVHSNNLVGNIYVGADVAANDLSIRANYIYASSVVIAGAPTFCDNTLYEAPGTLTISGSPVLRNNTYIVTKNSGSSSITSGATSVAVTHGLDVTPSAEDIFVIGKENPTNSVGTIWVDTIGATQFTVNVENDPGASNWDFGWRVDTE